MYTQTEFARIIKRRGLPGRKAQIEAYLASHPKATYTEDDLIDYSRSNPTEYLHSGKRLGKCADGQDWNSPGNERNGGADPLWQINSIYRAMDRDREKRCRKADT